MKQLGLGWRRRQRRGKMDLDSLKFDVIVPDEPDPAIVNGEVIDDTIVKCGKCEVDGSTQLPNGTCDTCGAAWEEFSDDEEDDFSIALELLQSCLTRFEMMLKNHGLRNKMGLFHETELRNLMMTVDDFLDTYAEWPPTS